MFKKSLGYDEQKLKEFTPEQKWTLLCQMQQVNQTAAPKPVEYISELKKDCKLEVWTKLLNQLTFLQDLEHLVVTLKGEKVQWIEKFVEMEGVLLLTKILSGILKKRKYGFLLHSPNVQLV